MPTSSPNQIPTVIEAAITITPHTVLEVGIGCGKYGALLREYLTVWDHYFEPWDSIPFIMDGIEVHGMYASSPAWACYDNTTVGDARDIVPNIPAGCYDMGLMVDVLEHFEHDEGLVLVSAMLDACKTLLIAVPTHVGATVEVWGNPHEIHKADWTQDFLREHGYTVKVYHDEDYRVMAVTR